MSENLLPCPCCKTPMFEEYGSFDICLKCNWQDDIVQLNNPDFAGGANHLSLNEYTEQYLQHQAKHQTK